MSKSASIYRMVTQDHLCPWGLKAMSLLRRKGFEVEDYHLKTKEENREYKLKNRVSETPQIFLDGQHIGGYEALRKELGMKPEQSEGTTYQPVVAIFSVSFLMAVSVAVTLGGGLDLVRVLELFVAISMCVLGIMKLRDLGAFSTQFLSYDLLARRFVPYAYVFPFLETGAGILMIGGFLVYLAAPAALVIGGIGAISVVKAVYVDKRELKCACVGGNSSVPLGFISLTEDLMMVAMAIWMMVKPMV